MNGKRMLRAGALLLAGACALTGCKKAAAASGDAPASSPSAGGEMTAFERSIVGPMLEDVRQGVRPFDANGIGICRTSGKDCQEFLGAEPGTLPPGKYLVKAELAVPQAGSKGTWKINFETECAITSKSGSSESTTTNKYSHSYDVIYAGADRGYRLMPLTTIDSPSPAGARKCTYKITAPHPDGDKVYTGSWSVEQT